ncbi:hypothetical protein [Lacrimispora celerecrescens]|uniref:Uncharacterized protein n=1 Tax=[Clostridium] celerecrescens 18A TaxID=1286362 RepID=A0A2M8Z9M7_9FIRM|nr:hypothetical protein [Lacrimispora celerecrescens]PJJ30158.1 hypothetical protein H171_3735 [[Clostridium] celerecrescens 18A]
MSNKFHQENILLIREYIENTRFLVENTSLLFSDEILKQIYEILSGFTEEWNVKLVGCYSYSALPSIVKLDKDYLIFDFHMVPILFEIATILDSQSSLLLKYFFCMRNAEIEESNNNLIGKEAYSRVLAELPIHNTKNNYLKSLFDIKLDILLQCVFLIFHELGHYMPLNIDRYKEIVKYCSSELLHTELEDSVLKEVSADAFAKTCLMRFASDMGIDINRTYRMCRRTMMSTTIYKTLILNADNLIALSQRDVVLSIMVEMERDIPGSKLKGFDIKSHRKESSKDFSFFSSNLEDVCKFCISRYEYHLQDLKEKNKEYTIQQSDKRKNYLFFE